jgi:hypothetical protein
MERPFVRARAVPSEAADGLSARSSKRPTKDCRPTVAPRPRAAGAERGQPHRNLLVVAAPTRGVTATDAPEATRSAASRQSPPAQWPWAIRAAVSSLRRRTRRGAAGWLPRPPNKPRAEERPPAEPTAAGWPRRPLLAAEPRACKPETRKWRDSSQAAVYAFWLEGARGSGLREPAKHMRAGPCLRGSSPSRSMLGAGSAPRHEVCSSQRSKRQATSHPLTAREERAGLGWPREEGMDEQEAKRGAETGHRGRYANGNAARHHSVEEQPARPCGGCAIVRSCAGSGALRTSRLIGGTW